MAVVVRSRVSSDPKSKVGAGGPFTGGEAATRFGGSGAFDTAFGVAEGAGAGAGAGATADDLDATTGGADSTTGVAPAAGDGAMVFPAQPASARTTMRAPMATTAACLITV